jgi:hypothetical protein
VEAAKRAERAITLREKQFELKKARLETRKSEEILNEKFDPSPENLDQAT